jgi:putative ABC transport system ATP-binding protein
MSVPIIELKHITKIFKDDPTKTPILKDISLKIDQGEFVAIMGPSGSGKSTLLNILGLLDKPTSGEYLLDGEHITPKTRSTHLAFLRRQKIGFIFQNFNLIPRVNALGNVELPMVYSRFPNRRARAKELLKKVELTKRLYARPNQLSGGEQQRVAIARALVNRPKILLADEPTGNLDSKTGHTIMALLKHLNREDLTIIMVTHEKEIAAFANRVIHVKDGRIT